MTRRFILWRIGILIALTCAAAAIGDIGTAWGIAIAAEVLVFDTIVRVVRG